MLKIDKGSPWIMWPDSMVENFIENPANKVFDCDKDFLFKLIFSLPNPITEKSTLFSKLPSYFGIDLEVDGMTFIVSYETGQTEYVYIKHKWETNTDYELVIGRKEKELYFFVNRENVLNFTLRDRLSSDSTSHIIFGAGNFPKNGFNLNYLDVDLKKLQIFQENALIVEHDFDIFIYNKSFDKTENCNFIHKI
jgi:hypothetical protein